MDLRGILRRIEKRLKAVGKTADGVSREAGKPDAIRNLRRAVKANGAGRSGITTATLHALAPVLETTELWLLKEEGPETLEEAGRAIVFVSAPLISWVSAGEIKKPEHVDRFEDAPRVSAPGLDPKGEWIALKVDGDSMDRISPPESIIFVNLRDRRLVPNACYVISDEEGGSAYRRYRTNPLRWEPVSQNPVHEAHFIDGDKTPRVIGRVKKTVLDM